MPNAAVDDGALLANPADKLGRQLRLVTPARTHQENVKAFDREQRDRFLGAARQLEPRLFPLFVVLSQAGLRPGEGLALQWDDRDFEERDIRVARARTTTGELSTPKSGHGRTVDMSAELAAVLQRVLRDRKAEALRRGGRGVPPWVACTTSERMYDHAAAERALKRILKATGLPMHFTPHCMRHTFASLLLRQGESIEYVKRQLGHASIQLTVDTYGKWLPRGNKAAVDRLDDPSGSKVVAEAGRRTGQGAQVPEKERATRRSRTGDLLITNWREPPTTHTPDDPGATISGTSAE
jgi:integrase